MIASHPLATHAAAFCSGVLALRMLQAWALRRWRVARNRMLPPAPPKPETWGGPQDTWGS